MRRTSGWGTLARGRGTGRQESLPISDHRPSRRLRWPASAVSLALVAALGMVEAGRPAAAATCPTPRATSDVPRVVRRPFLSLAVNPCGTGYVLLDQAGGLFTFGNAEFHGSVPALRDAGQPIPDPGSADVAMTPSGSGYAVLDRDGGVFTFGDARFSGSVPGLRRDGRQIPLVEVVNISMTATGGGYLVLDINGGVFAFGDGRFSGSLPGLRAAGLLSGLIPAVDLALTPSGGGYLVVDRLGGLYAFGDARFSGSLPSLRDEGRLQGEVEATAVDVTPSNNGYVILDRTGGVFAFGDAPFAGSAAGREGVTPALDIKLTETGNGYWVLFANGVVHAFGDAIDLGSVDGVLVPSETTVRGLSVSGPARSAQEIGALDMAYEIFDRVNDERVARGLEGLEWDPGLEVKADEWSRDMSANGFRHGGYLRVDTSLFPGLGENIARATGASLLNAGVFHSGWMNSDGHRENILNQGFDAVGVSVYCVGTSLWATQIFGRRAGSTRPPLTDGVPPRDPVVWPDAGGPSC